MTRCRKHYSTVFTKYPCTCQWLCVMREFRKKHEEKCNATELTGPSYKTHEFLTGSLYEGGWQEGCGMHGYGAYTFTNGVEYVGEFFEGVFHGKGELRYQTYAGKVTIRGQWCKGKITEKTIVFDDALEHEPNDWQYCKMPDRRFTREYVDGVQPSGNSFLTAYEPYLEVPEGYYDTGDGYYDNTRKMVYEYGDYLKILRAPGPAEQKWIQENCRVGKKDLIVSPRPDLYEQFIEAKTLPEPVPLPPNKTMDIARKQSTFEQYEDQGGAPLFYDPQKWGRSTT